MPSGATKILLSLDFDINDTSGVSGIAIEVPTPLIYVKVLESILYKV